MFDLIRSHAKLTSFKAYLGDEGDSAKRNVKTSTKRTESLKTAPR